MMEGGLWYYAFMVKSLWEFTWSVVSWWYALVPGAVAGALWVADVLFDKAFTKNRKLLAWVMFVSVFVASFLAFHNMRIQRNELREMVSNLEKQASEQIKVLNPQQEKLLMLIHQYQVNLGVRKLIIGLDGHLHFDEPSKRNIKINIADELLGGLNSPERAKDFEVIMDRMPPEYLRRIPEMRLGSPYVVTVTEEGIRYLEINKDN